MKKLLIILSLLLITGCNKPEYSRNYFYMDTLIDVKLYNVSQKKAEQAFKEIDNIYKKYHEISNKYDESSELYKLNNRNSKDEYLSVSKELYDLIKFSYDFYDKSHGLLNINIGKITEIWKNFRNKNINLPTTEIKTIDTSIGNIVLKDGTIANKDFNIDLGATAKGYVTQLVGNYLKQAGVEYFLINAGGNVLSGKSLKENYKIGIASPNPNEDYISIVKGNNFAVVTSGGSERFFEVDGIKYHHIIDPNTYFPANYMKSVTVIGTDSAICDALSTTLFLMPIDEGLEFIKSYNVEAIWVSNDNQIIKSEGYSKYE